MYVGLKARQKITIINTHRLITWLSTEFVDKSAIVVWCAIQDGLSG